MKPHYAKSVPFDQLLDELESARAEKLVYAREDGHLQLWCYTKRAVYDKAWPPAVQAARGLVLDLDRRSVVATPFPKFFNVGEQGTVILDEPFEVFEKVDGSLIVLFHDGKNWRAATKGAFDSSQAIWADARLGALDLDSLKPGNTYLAEAVYPENRIVVKYAQEEMVLLAAYDRDGFEVSFAELSEVADRLGWRVARRETFKDVAELYDRAQHLSQNEEGFVLRFESGLRLKLKGKAYARTHAMISRVTPLGLWNVMLQGDDLDVMRREVPEEFWWDFDQIRARLDEALALKMNDIAKLAVDVAHMSDKELGLVLDTLPKASSRYIFNYRRNPNMLDDERTKQAWLKDIRPQGNDLPGYVASYAIQRIAGDE
jgi:RNA ligase